MMSRTRGCAPNPIASPATPAPVNTGVISRSSSFSTINNAMPTTSAVVAFCTTEPSVRARLPRSIASRSVPRLISYSKRRTTSAVIRTSAYERSTMSRILRPGPKNQSDSERRWTPVRGRSPAISKAGKSRTASASVKAASVTIRSGPRTCGLDVATVSRSMARRPAVARRLASRDSSHAATSVVTSAMNRARGSMGSEKNRVDISAGHLSPSASRVRRWSGRCGLRQVLGAQLRGRMQRDAQAGTASLAIGSILQHQASAMCLCDLTAQDQPDPRPARLGGEKRNKQVPGVRETGPLVLDPQLHGRRVRPGQPLPANRYTAAGFADSIDSVSDQIDEQLLELIPISLNGQARPCRNADVMRFFQSDDAIDESGDIEGNELWRRQFREAGIRAHEPAQGLRSRGDHPEAALHVVTPVGRRRLALDNRRKAPGDRLDGRQRVVHLVTDDADKPLPGLTLLFAQWLAEIGEHQ